MITLLLAFLACGNNTNETKTAETTQQTEEVKGETPVVQKPETTKASANTPATTVENTTTATVNGNNTETTNTDNTVNGETNETND